MRGYPYILNQDQFRIMRELVKSILENPLDCGREWSLQGFGMLRLYLSPTLRLHVWSQEHVVQNVSTIHDHPWDFSSFVLSGRVDNRRLQEVPHGKPTHFKRTIKCGPGGHAMPDETKVCLVADPLEIVRAGEAYGQLAAELHCSQPSHGAVSIIERLRPAGRDPDLATVCYPLGTEWVSAEPRPATRAEVFEITDAALSRWSTL